MRFLKLLFIGSVILSGLKVTAQESVSLAGTWQFKLDSQDVGIQQKWYDQPFEGSVQLPGTLDDARVGAGTQLSDTKLVKEVLLRTNLTK